MGNLASRVAVAAVGAPILLVAMTRERPEWVWAIVFCASIVAMHEFFAMTLEARADRTASIACGAIACALLYWGAAPVGHQLALVAALILPALYYLFRFGDMTTVATRFAASVTGIFYAGLLLTFVAMIKRDFRELGGTMTIFVLLVTWMADTGAYFAGRFMGKRKLYPAVSPGKTWAGAIGGVAGAFVAAAVLKVTLLEQLTWLDVAILAVPGVVLGQLGDLVESMIKRSRNVKDSGGILPGHGGILDRVDALLFYAPFVYLYFPVKSWLVALW